MSALDITVVNCRGVKGKDLFSESDPYVVLRLGEQKQKTRVEKDAGADADFHQTFAFEYTGLHWDLEVQVFDKDLLFDQLMGKATVDLRPIVEKGAWLGECELHDKKGKRNGSVTFTVKCRVPPAHNHRTS